MTILSVNHEEHCSQNNVSQISRLPSTRLLKGNIEGTNLGVLSGWVVDTACEGNSIAVEVYNRNQLVAWGTADWHREDLVEAGYKKGAFGFNLALDTSVLDGNEHLLHLRLPENSEILATKALRASPFAVSRIDEIEAGVVCGHVELIESSEHTGFDIELLLDGEPVREGMCLQKDGAENYPFSVSVPTDLFDDNNYVFTIRVKGLLTIQEPFQTRLPSIGTPWQYINDSGSGTRLSAMSKVAAYRYAALQRNLDETNKMKSAEDLSRHFSNVKLAHDILVEGYENRKKFPNLKLPVVSNPKVSIIIPAYNNFALTYHCIASLILAKNIACYEVLVVDDTSSDETLKIDEYVQNLRVVRNEKNMGFLLSSKRGAEQANGEFLVFLNNDTEVTCGWIDSLLETFSIFDSVGMVGSKLIYPNGKLQEAGGIVWSSGKPWNIGNGKNAEHPMYNYTRQSDYISGASLMIRRSVWDEIGGFSEELVPAYYEDTDLAFKVREAGYKTMYCPFSTVIHFEGMSNGVDTNASIKRFQSVNAPKFRAKWRHAFRHNGVEGKQLSRNMDRGVDFRALVIDYTTPRPDQDAGGYAAIQEMMLLQELGCKVTFIPNNLAHMGRHTELLQKRGVECIFGPFYKSVGDLLQDRRDEFDLVYVTRYDIAEQVIPSIKQLANAKIIFNNADLHFLRELRAALACGETSFELPLRTRERELQVMRDVDAVLSYNEVEHSVIASHNLTVENVFRCPWVLEDRRSEVPFGDRQGIAFLGGFNHMPNREAVKYFVETVMPLLRIAQPGIKFHVYGSKISPDIEELACSDVIIEGYVENLAEVFDTCRVFLAPLLSGAGIKGKVLESIAHGVPCVLSSVAVEATGLLDGHSTFVAQCPDEWCEKIVELYNVENTWNHLAENSHALVYSEYGVESGLAAMRKVLKYVELDPAEKQVPVFSR